jgi:hypothetical protein
MGALLSSSVVFIEHVALRYLVKWNNLHHICKLCLRLRLLQPLLLLLKGHFNHRLKLCSACCLFKDLVYFWFPYSLIKCFPVLLNLSLSNLNSLIEKMRLHIVKFLLSNVHGAILGLSVKFEISLYSQEPGLSSFIELKLEGK